MHKLSYLADDEWAEFSFPPVFEKTTTTNGMSRIVGTVPHGDAEVFERLVQRLEPPYYLLYVLHTPRGEDQPGRYQSPELNVNQVYEFLDRFKTFLAADARFDLWAHSPAENATVVWDRHNLLYAYGPLEEFTSALRALGFVEDEPKVPSPHQHHYRQEFDDMAKELLNSLEWSYSPLLPQDEQ